VGRKAWSGVEEAAMDPTGPGISEKEKKLLLSSSSIDKGPYRVGAVRDKLEGLYFLSVCERASRVLYIRVFHMGSNYTKNNIRPQILFRYMLYT